MIKNKNGFTLVELLAVLAIIGVLAVIAVPSFSSVKKSQINQFDNSLKIMLVSAAKIYVVNNKEYVDELIDENNNSYCVALGTLKAYDYIDVPTINPVTMKVINPRTCINISKNVSQTNKVKYNYNVTNNLKEGDYIPPTIKLQEKDGVLDGTCTKTMNIDSRDKFDEQCSVVVTDNVDSDVILDKPTEEENMDDTYILKYVTTDSSKNISNKLTVKLIINK